MKYSTMFLIFAAGFLIFAALQASQNFAGLNWKPLARAVEVAR